jgi:hypothetical protein
MLITNPLTFTSWDELQQLVAGHVNECPVFLQLDAVKRAAQEFFRRSGVWRTDEVTLLTTVAAQQSYAHAPTINAQLERVYSAWSGEDELDVSLPGEAANTPNATTESDATQLRIEARDGNVLWLSPMPATAGTVVRGTLVYVPTRAGAGIPLRAFDEWGTGIAARAAAELVIEPGKQWSSPGMYGGLMSLFSNACMEASVAGGPVRRKPLRTTTGWR